MQWCNGIRALVGGILNGVAPRRRVQWHAGAGPSLLLYMLCGPFRASGWCLAWVDRGPTSRTPMAWTLQQYDRNRDLWTHRLYLVTHTKALPYRTSTLCPRLRNHLVVYALPGRFGRPAQQLGRMESAKVNYGMLSDCSRRGPTAKSWFNQ